MGLVDFLYGWQELMGALFGAFIAVILAYVISHYSDYKKEKREIKGHYSNLLLILYDLQHFISKCEEFIKQSKSKRLFDRISLNDRLNYVATSQFFDLELEIYSHIQYLYSEANVIKSKMDSGDYGEAIELIRYYLTSFYHKFNVTTKEIKELKEYHKYLKFPKDITFYEKDYVEKKIKEFSLENHHPTNSQS